MLLSKKQVYLGEVPPMGYALAWNVPHCDAAVFYPFPLNIPIAWGRALWLWLKWKAVPQEARNRALDAEYYSGVKEGRDAEREHQEYIYPYMVQASCRAAYEKGLADAKANAV